MIGKLVIQRWAVVAPDQAPESVLIDTTASQVQRRMDQAYQDKLDGKISEEFWMRKSGEWQAEENQIRASVRALEIARSERFPDPQRF